MDRYKKQHGNSMYCKRTQKEQRFIDIRIQGIQKSEKLGDVYLPIWFAYNFMDGFLRNIYQCNGVRNTQVGKEKPTLVQYVHMTIKYLLTAKLILSRYIDTGNKETVSK